MQLEALSKFVEPITQNLPSKFKDTFFLRTFGLLKVPMIFWLSPTVLEATDERCVVKIPLNRRTKNHLNSMYFGALCVGADCAGGLIPMRFVHQKKARVSLIFKDFKAEFLKRAEGDVLFTCEQGQEITEFTQKVMDSGERMHMPVRVTATVPSKHGTEPVAQFTLNLSMKRKSS